MRTSALHRLRENFRDSDDLLTALLGVIGWQRRIESFLFSQQGDVLSANSGSEHAPQSVVLGVELWLGLHALLARLRDELEWVAPRAPSSSAVVPPAPQLAPADLLR